MSRIVLKVGGKQAPGTVPALVEGLASHGDELCLVHGAGPQITDEMERFGLPVEFVGGRRVTSRAGLAIVRASLAAVNDALCATVGPRAVGMFGDEIGLYAVQVPELGLVGDPLPCRPRALESALAGGRIPVVAPLGVGPLNVNADEAAAALAVGLEADRILFVTDVPGLLLEGGVVSSIRVDDADGLLETGGVEGGIVPKLRAAVRAARLGIRAEIGETVVVG